MTPSATDARSFFVKDPTQEDIQPIRELVEVPTKVQIGKLGRSAMLYGSTILISLGVVSWGGQYAFPSLIPLRWFARCV